MSSNNNFRGSNPTVPDLLRANKPVSYSQLQNELHSLRRAILYHGIQYIQQIMNADSVFALAMVPLPRHIERLEEEREMVLQAINDRRVQANLAALEAIRRSDRA
jgi:hypothetical protein